MPIDIKAELTRPPALLLAALATLGWVLFMLSSWSTASVQKAQRLQIVELTEKADRLSADLGRQVGAAGELMELQTKVGAMREELNRVSQARSDVQADLAAAQRSLQGVRKEVLEADRSLQTQSQKLSELQSNAPETTEAAAPAGQTARPTRRGGRKWTRRGRHTRSFSTISR
ncbi:MAG: chromosome segregation ATPase-like protein [Enterovirga sp.]|nr:chromosome segregation ATPase-like protein [Enterovirga sp.]